MDAAGRWALIRRQSRQLADVGASGSVAGAECGIRIGVNGPHTQPDGRGCVDSQCGRCNGADERYR